MDVYMYKHDVIGDTAELRGGVFSVSGLLQADRL